jgi:predicted lipoprotein with Yx(FWY)xxD motif
MLKQLIISCLVAVACLVVAQDDPAVVNVMQNYKLGSYLTDSDGNTLYMFINEDMASEDAERMTEGVRSNAVSCTGECLEAWPPLEATSVQAGEGVDPELLYTAEFDGMTMAVYNGWPLYYFFKDEKPGDTVGQGKGKAPDIWYVLNPDGSINETSME